MSALAKRRPSAEMAVWLRLHAPEEAAALKALIVAQHHDQESDRIRPQAHMTRECDLARGDGSFTLDSLPDRRPQKLTGLVGLNAVWSAREVQYDPADGRPCPACGTEPGGTDRRHLDQRGICCVCSASGSDPRQAPNAEPPPAKPSRKRQLAGGVGRATRKSRGDSMNTATRKQKRHVHRHAEQLRARVRDLAAAGASPETIAARVGRSVPYIKQLIRVAARAQPIPMDRA